MSDHNHTHAHSASNRIGWAFFLNVTFTIIELIGGWLTNSTAIMADAVHDLGDSISIGLAWLLNRLGNKPSDNAFTYGYQRFSLLGALINGFVLIAGSIWVLSMAVPRLFEPQQPHAVGMFWLALLGIAVNGYAAFKLSRGKTLNERVLNWHLLEDVLGWGSGADRCNHSVFRGLADSRSPAVDYIYSVHIVQCSKKCCHCGLTPFAGHS